MRPAITNTVVVVGLLGTFKAIRCQTSDFYVCTYVRIHVRTYVCMYVCTQHMC